MTGRSTRQSTHADGGPYARPPDLDGYDVAARLAVEGDAPEATVIASRGPAAPRGRGLTSTAARRPSLLGLATLALAGLSFGRFPVARSGPGLGEEGGVRGASRPARVAARADAFDLLRHK